MLSKVYSAAIHGLNAYVVSVQVDESNGLPRSMTLGNVSASVKEAIERVSIALKNLGLELPPKKITINLQPADLRKNGIRSCHFYGNLTGSLSKLRFSL